MGGTFLLLTALAFVALQGAPLASAQCGSFPAPWAPFTAKPGYCLAKASDLGSSNSGFDTQLAFCAGLGGSLATFPDDTGLGAQYDEIEAVAGLVSDYIGVYRTGSSSRFSPAWMWADGEDASSLNCGSASCGPWGFLQPLSSSECATAGTVSGFVARSNCGNSRDAVCQIMIPSPTPSPSQTPSATPSQTPSATPSQTPSATSSQTPSATPSQTPSATPSTSPPPLPCGRPLSSQTDGNGCTREDVDWDEDGICNGPIPGLSQGLPKRLDGSGKYISTRWCEVPGAADSTGSLQPILDNCPTTFNPVVPADEIFQRDSKRRISNPLPVQTSTMYGPLQTDTDNDGEGDACDADVSVTSGAESSQPDADSPDSEVPELAGTADQESSPPDANSIDDELDDGSGSPPAANESEQRASDGSNDSSSVASSEDSSDSIKITGGEAAPGSASNAPTEGGEEDLAALHSEEASSTAGSSSPSSSSAGNMTAVASVVGAAVAATALVAAVIVMRRVRGRSTSSTPKGTDTASLTATASSKAAVYDGGVVVSEGSAAAPTIDPESTSSPKTKTKTKTKTRTEAKKARRHKSSSHGKPASGRSRSHGRSRSRRRSRSRAHSFDVAASVV